MPELDDIPDLFGVPSTTGIGAKPRCKRHRWVLMIEKPTDSFHTHKCDRCGQRYDAVKAKRGKNNRSRGNAIEREIGHKLGLRRVGQYGGPDDLSGVLFAAQVKSGGSFPERFWSWLKAVPVNAGQTPLLVVTDAPGPGKRRRAVVVLDLDDWVSLHGPTAEEGAA